LLWHAGRGALGPAGTGTPLERRAEDLDPAYEPAIEAEPFLQALLDGIKLTV
jgi:hypothetical protein